MSLATPNLAGTAPGRLPGLDALRGFALFGIVIVNAPFIAVPVPFASPANAGDAAVIALVAIFGMGKFFLIFSFLFGFGFAASFQRPGEAAGRSRARFLRRMFGLFVLGALHAALFFFGDILMLYALLGLALWSVRSWPIRRLMIAAAFVYALAIPLQATILFFVIGETASLPVDRVSAATAAYLGDFGSAMRQRLADLPNALTFNAVFNGLPALAMFLAGAAAGRSGRFPPDAARLADLRATFAVSLAVGAACSTAGALVAAGAPYGPMLFAGLLAMSLAAPALSLGMAGLVLGLAETCRNASVVRWLAAAGGSSLTGYILHTVILGAIFYGWGLGLYGRFGDLAVLAVACLTFLLVVLLLNVWRVWFRFGPDEWLLRSFTDLEWKPLRRPRAGA